MKKTVKIVFINIMVLVGILWCTNFIVLTIFRIQKLHKRIYGPSLPNYKNVKWAAVNSVEFDNLIAEFRSYAGWRRVPFKGETITVDSDGIRVTPQSPLVNGSSRVMAFLGGSTMWGTGSNDSGTIPALVSKMANGKYRTVNLGESGYKSIQEYFFLQLQIMKGLHPSIVVAYDGFNDGSDLPVDTLDHYFQAQEELMKKRMASDDIRSSLSLRSFFIGPVTDFYAIAAKKLAKAPKNRVLYSPERLKATAHELLEAWLAAKHLGDHNGFTFIGILQPCSYNGHPRLDYLPKSVINDNRYEYYKYVFELLKEPRYLELAPDVFDCTDAYDGNEMIYIDNIHVTPNGNAKIAKRLLDYITNLK